MHKSKMDKPSHAKWTSRSEIRCPAYRLPRAHPTLHARHPISRPCVTLNHHQQSNTASPARSAMSGLALIGEVGHIAFGLVQHVYYVTLGACLSPRRTPPSPTLSAQEGELDNLLAQPTGGWDDDSISIAPKSTRYGKEGLLSARQRSDSAATRRSNDWDRTGDQDARVLGDVDARTVGGLANWEPGVSMNDLAREEAELAKMDPPGPSEEFGDFEQALQEPAMAETKP